jgi:hypothetical protein
MTIEAPIILGPRMSESLAILFHFIADADGDIQFVADNAGMTDERRAAFLEDIEAIKRLTVIERAEVLKELDSSFYLSTQPTL